MLITVLTIYKYIKDNNFTRKNKHEKSTNILTFSADCANFKNIFSGDIMIIIRPITKDDYDALFQIAKESGHGFTSLPEDKDYLINRIKHSQQSFAADIKSPGNQGYLFVMEDTNSKEIVGTSGIEASTGSDFPLFHHRIGTHIHHNDKLKVHKELETLTLCNDLTGSSEICSLFLKSDYRIKGNGRALSRFRFLFMSEHPERFSNRIMAEMRGYADENGESPFWSWFEENFCDIDFATSNYLFGTGDMTFVSELMPKFPLYTKLMTQSARDGINKVHPGTRPALALLEKEGFKYGDYIGVNDAGPALISPLDRIKTVMASVKKPVKIAAVTNEQTRYIACNNKLTDFRAAQIYLDIQDEHLVISEESATALKVAAGDFLRVVKNN